MPYREVVAATGLCVREFASELDQAMQDDLVEWLEGGILRLTAKGQQYAEQCSLRHQPQVRCDQCHGRGVDLRRPPYASLLQQFRDLTADRPQPLAKYDQGPVRPEVTVARVALMDLLGDLDGQRILVLGDDDLTGLALGLTGKPAAVEVLDIDTRILEFIAEKARSAGIRNLSVHQYDVRDPLPANLQKSCDVFLTDPVETLPGFTLFLSRCAEALRGARTAGYFGLTKIEASRYKWLLLQRRLTEMGFAITDALRDFNTYLVGWADMVAGDRIIEGTKAYLPSATDSPQEDWYRSTLIRVEAANAPTPLFLGSLDLGPALYKDDDSYEYLVPLES